MLRLITFTRGTIVSYFGGMCGELGWFAFHYTLMKWRGVLISLRPLILRSGHKSRIPSMQFDYFVYFGLIFSMMLINLHRVLLNSLFEDGGDAWIYS